MRYLDTLVSAAGFEWRETAPGADALAIDGSLIFPEGSVGIQVKTTHTHLLTGTNARMTQAARDHWIQSWKQALHPLYFVVVVVPNATKGMPWLEHQSTGTYLPGTAAFWSRIDPTQFTAKNNRVGALRKQRVTADTFPVWQRDLITSYGG